MEKTPGGRSMRPLRMTKTLTSGNPAKLIFLFTIPLLIGNLFQQF